MGFWKQKQRPDVDRRLLIRIFIRRLSILRLGTSLEIAKSMPLLSLLINDKFTEPRDMILLLFLSDEKKQEFISKRYKNNSPLQQKRTAVFFF